MLSQASGDMVCKALNFQSEVSSNLLEGRIIPGTVDPVINDLLSPTTFFLHGTFFYNQQPVINDFPSKATCHLKYVAGHLLVSNFFIIRLLETLMSKPLHVRSDCVDIMVNREIKWWKITTFVSIGLSRLSLLLRSNTTMRLSLWTAL